MNKRRTCLDEELTKWTNTLKEQSQSAGRSALWSGRGAPGIFVGSGLRRRRRRRRRFLQGHGGRASHRQRSAPRTRHGGHRAPAPAAAAAAVAAAHAGPGPRQRQPLRDRRLELLLLQSPHRRLGAGRVFPGAVRGHALPVLRRGVQAEGEPPAAAHYQHHAGPRAHACQPPQHAAAPARPAARRGGQASGDDAAHQRRAVAGDGAGAGGGGGRAGGAAAAVGGVGAPREGAAAVDGVRGGGGGAPGGGRHVLHLRLHVSEVARAGDGRLLRPRRHVPLLRARAVLPAGRGDLLPGVDGFQVHRLPHSGGRPAQRRRFEPRGHAPSNLLTPSAAALGPPSEARRAPSQAPRPPPAAAPPQQRGPREPRLPEHGLLRNACSSVVRMKASADRRGRSTAGAARKVPS